MRTHLLRRGKGKDDGAVGLAVRAAGWEKGIVTRFLKTDHSGEVAALGLIPEFRLHRVKELRIFPSV